MRAVVLPGLDGSVALREGFVRAAPTGCGVEVTEYPSHLARYDDLADHMRPYLRERADVLVAESFSGPLAVRLAADGRHDIGAVVLIASFVSTPRRLPGGAAALTRCVPSQHEAFARAAAPMLIGRERAGTFAPELAEAMRTVEPRVVAARIGQVLQADERSALRRLDLPVLYLRASDDHMVPPRAAEVVRRHARDVRVVTIEGPHFLAQAAPKACWAEIEQFLQR